MYRALLPFLLRVGHVTLLFLWMIFPDILGFISSKIVLNFIKSIVTLPKRLKHSFLNLSKFSNLIIPKNIKPMNLILHQFGTVPHSSCPGTSQQNGRDERKLRHILDVVRSTTIAASTPSQF